MSAEDIPETKVTVEKRRNGRWAFVITRGTVVYPAQGQFTNMFEASNAAQQALKALGKRS